MGSNKILIKTKKGLHDLEKRIKSARTDADFQELYTLFGDRTKPLDTQLSRVYLPINAIRAKRDDGTFLETEKAICVEKSSDGLEPEYQIWIPRSCSEIQDEKIYVQRWIIEKNKLEINWQTK